MSRELTRGDFVRANRMRLRRLFAIFGILSLLIAGTVASQAAAPAYAANYPSWGDVQAARASVAAKAAEIKRLDGLLSSLENEVNTAQALAIQRGDEYQAAQQKARRGRIQGRRAQEAGGCRQGQGRQLKQHAGQLAAQLARMGGGDLSTSLFFSGDDANDLLSQLGLASVVKDRSASLYVKAAQDENIARSMSNQATLAEDALKVLAADAQKALDEANAASDRAGAALAEQEANKTRLEAQRASLASNSATTEASYKAGVRPRAAAAAAKAAAEWAAAHPAPPAAPAGNGSSSGWVRPAGGHISSGYGYRINPVTGKYALHAGTDLARGLQLADLRGEFRNRELRRLERRLRQLHPHQPRRRALHRLRTHRRRRHPGARRPAGVRRPTDCPGRQHGAVDRMPPSLRDAPRRYRGRPRPVHGGARGQARLERPTLADSSPRGVEKPSRGGSYNPRREQLSPAATACRAAATRDVAGRRADVAERAVSAPRP